MLESWIPHDHEQRFYVHVYQTGYLANYNYITTPMTGNNRQKTHVVISLSDMHYDER